MPLARRQTQNVLCVPMWVLVCVCVCAKQRYANVARGVGTWYTKIHHCARPYIFSISSIHNTYNRQTVCIRNDIWKWEEEAMRSFPFDERVYSVHFYRSLCISTRASLWSRIYICFRHSLNVFFCLCPFSIHINHQSRKYILLLKNI